MEVYWTTTKELVVNEKADPTSRVIGLIPAFTAVKGRHLHKMSDRSTRANVLLEDINEWGWCDHQEAPPSSEVVLELVKSKEVVASGNPDTQNQILSSVAKALGTVPADTRPVSASSGSAARSRTPARKKH